MRHQVAQLAEEARQAAVRESSSTQALRERLTAALDASATGTFRWDLDSGALDCDDNLAALLGRTQGSSLACLDDLIERVHADDRDEVLRRWHACGDGVELDLEFRAVWPDGTQRWLAAHGRRRRDGAGAAGYVTGACTDVTERRRTAEENARFFAASEAERHYRILTDAMPQLVWTARPDGRVDYANERWFEYTGLGLERTQTAGLAAALHPDDRVRVLEHWAHAVERGAPLQIQGRLRRGDGVHRWFLIRALPMRGLAGEVRKWFGTCTDIDDQKRAEAQIEESNRAKDEFLAMLSHELRNPLAPIVTALHLMREKSDGSTDRERTVIERQVDHLVRLVDDLLDVARITRGKIELRQAPLDVVDVVRSAVEIVGPMMAQRRHLVDVAVPRDGLIVDGDHARLAQVIANLLSNAAKYTAPGGHIRVSAHRDETHVAIAVSDDGMGIAPELAPRIFDLFVQGERSVDRADGGLGVGLTVVKNLVAMHGGTVAVHSEGAGTGSTFTVRLPALQSTPGPWAALASVTTAARPVPAQRVLVVDDNIDVAELFAEVLRSQGHTVAIVHDGAAALQLAEAFRPDIAMVDIGLPVMDGYELAGYLRARLGDACPRLIAITGYGQARDRARSRDAGFDVHLVKPVDTRRLLAGLAAANNARER